MIFFLALSGFACGSPTHASRPRVALLGDSMTWISGQDCENPTGWAYYLKQAGVTDTLMIFARSGATWTNTSSTKANPLHYSEILDDQNVIYNQVIRLIDFCKTHQAPDKINIYAGANDAWFQDKRPGIFSPCLSQPGDPQKVNPAECTSLTESIELCVGLLKSHFPNADITLITPVEAGKIPTARIHKVGDTIQQTGSRLGIPVLRGDRNIPILHEEEKDKRRHYTYDGAHTNPEGARLIARYIMSELFPQQTNN